MPVQKSLETYWMFHIYKGSSNELSSLYPLNGYM